MGNGGKRAGSAAQKRMDTTEMEGNGMETGGMEKNGMETGGMETNGMEMNGKDTTEMEEDGKEMEGDDGNGNEQQQEPEMEGNDVASREGRPPTESFQRSASLSLEKGETGVLGHKS